MTALEGLALKQAVALLQQAAINEGQSLFSTVSDHCDTMAVRLFQDYILEDEEWTAANLTEGVIKVIREDLVDYGYRLPE